ncbi:MAG: RNA polymerase sigma-70 factor [Tannerellaceae bacterium]|jgi:RNA polymerase sigma-70 factor (ECF subfamily)|nr:RNA polymerase sigma-70 factor [Tannerellaceae bacterium]
MSADLETFNRLFIEYRERFVRFAYTYIMDQTVAEDFTTEAFLYYWENRDSLAPGSNIPAYILTTIKHKCLNYLTHARVRDTAAEDIHDHVEWNLNMRIATLEACDPDGLFRTDAQLIVDKTLGSLSGRTRHVFVLSRYHNKSHKEIASILQISPKAVESHICKALKALRLSLEDYI